MTAQITEFRAWVKEQGGVTKVAKLLGHSVPYVSRIHSGTRTPGLQLASRIERLAGSAFVSFPDGHDEPREFIRLPASGWFAE